MYIQVKAELIELAALFVAKPKDPRDYLHGVAVQPHPDRGVYVVATDGHRLAVFHDPEGVTDAAEAIIPVSRDLKKALKPARKNDPERTLILESGENWPQASAAVFDLQYAEPEPGEEAHREIGALRHAETLSLIDGRFPEWARVIPSNVGEAAHPAVNPAYLEDFCRVAKSRGSVPMIRLYAGQSDRDSMLIRTIRDDFVGVLMPMRWNDAEPIPHWLGTKSNADREPEPADPEPADPDTNEEREPEKNDASE